MEKYHQEPFAQEKEASKLPFRGLFLQELCSGNQGKSVSTPDHLKNNQYLAYVMDDILRLKNRADLSSCKLSGLQKYMGC